MPRQNRIEQNGFYHIINRGVAKNTIYHDDEDFNKFLEIVNDASDEYGFEIYSFCLMDNHYHLLMKIINQNLSMSLQKINARYSIYYNKKYERVGPLWQGRFKSWYIYDSNYLNVLVRYIEFNPVKAKLCKKIGQYRWSMSSRGFRFSMLNYELIDSTNFDKEMDLSELKKIDELYNTKVKMKDIIDKKELKPLEEYFETLLKEEAIFCAIKDGYKASQLAEHLELSKSTVSRILKKYRQKVKLFNKLKDKGVFQSYSKDVEYATVGEKLTIENLLKYGDFNDIALGFKLFGKRPMKKALGY